MDFKPIADRQVLREVESARALGFAFIGRQVADLEQAVAFYEAIGFSVDGERGREWTMNTAESRLYDTGNARCRSLHMGIRSAATGEPFVLVLRQYADIERNDWSVLKPWDLGAAHIGLGVLDPDAFWADLQATGLLRPLTSGGLPIPMPGDFDPPGRKRLPFASFLDPDGTAIEIQPPRDPRPESPMNVQFERQGSGFNHININVRELESAERFYGLLNVRFPPGPRKWIIHPWLDDVFGLPRDIHSWKIVNGDTPEAWGGSDRRMIFELIAIREFQSATHLARMHFADINVTSLGIDVRGIDELHAQLVAAGGRTWSDGIVALDDGTRAVVLRDPQVGTFIELRERQRDEVPTASTVSVGPP